MRTWLWESGAIASSIALLASMVALLAAYDNQQVFSFHGVTLNAIISLLSTLSKACLAFVLTAAIGQWKWILFSREPRRTFDAFIIDEASRGPLGSLRMIWRMRIGVASIGALCTVFALAMDPFTQQMIQFRDRAISIESNNANIPRSQRFSKGTFSRMGEESINITSLSQIPDNSSDADLTHAAADLSIESAALYGLIKPMELVQRQLPFSCSTGNCTFTPFPSLAVCSSCFDLSNQLVASADDVPLGQYVTGTATFAVARPGTRFTLPNGLYVSNFNNNTYDDQLYPLYMVALGTGNSSKTVKHQDVDTLIWSMTMIRVRRDQENPSAKWPNLPMDALECGLRYCVNQYFPSVEGGLLSESFNTNTSAQRSPESWQVISRVGIVNIPVTPSIEYEPTLSYLGRSDLSIGEGYNISEAAVNSISAYFQSFLSSPNSKGVKDYRQFLNAYYLGPDSYAQFAPDSMQELYQSPNLNATFAAIAASLSNAIRAGADNETVHTGALIHTEVRYFIQWPWIALHVLLVLLGLLYLILTITVTSAERVPAWKSHLLASIVWGKQLHASMKGAKTTEQMEEMAKLEMATYRRVDRRPVSGKSFLHGFGLPAHRTCLANKSIGDLADIDMSMFTQSKHDEQEEAKKPLAEVVATGRSVED